MEIEDVKLSGRPMTWRERTTQFLLFLLLIPLLPFGIIARLIRPGSRLQKFRAIVNERGRELRGLSFDELRADHDRPTENLLIDSRPATIDIIVQPQASGGLRVVVQGFMDTRPIRGIKQVALDGFYKYPDQTLAPMPDEEFYEFD